MALTEIILAVAAIGFLSGFVGVVLILLNIRWSERNLHWGIGFGAGLLIGTSLIEIIPAAIDLVSERAMAFVLAGFTAFFLIEKFTLIHHFDRREGNHHFHLSAATFAALCLHALLDGIVVGLGLRLDEVFGLVVFVAILFHKLPLAVSLASVFLATTPKKRAVFQMLLFSVATPAGLVLAVLFLGGLPEGAVGAMVGLSAGIFIYLGATDMLPEIKHAWEGENEGAGEEGGRWHRWIDWEPTLWVLLGMIVSFVPHQLIENTLHP